MRTKGRVDLIIRPKAVKWGVLETDQHGNPAPQITTSEEGRKVLAQTAAPGISFMDGGGDQALGHIHKCKGGNQVCAIHRGLGIQPCTA